MSKPEPDKPDSSESRSGGWWMPSSIVVLLLLLYVLSVAPLRKVMKGKTPSRVLIAFYTPLEYGYNHNAVVRRFYDWYFFMWGL